MIHDLVRRCAACLFCLTLFTGAAAVNGQDPAPAATEAAATETTPAEPAPVEPPPAEAAPDTPATSEPAPALRFLLLVPERMDVEWFWYYYTAESQHFVQSALERHMLRDGFELVDIASAPLFKEQDDIEEVRSNAFAIRAATELGATHVVVGSAEAVFGGSSHSYGVNVFRASADATVRIIQVSDGRVVSVENVSVTGGGQSQRTAGADALKKAGDEIARKVVRAARLLKGS